MMVGIFAAFEEMKVLLQQVVDQQLVALDLDGWVEQLKAISDGSFDTSAAAPKKAQQAGKAEPAAQAVEAPEPEEAVSRPETRAAPEPKKKKADPPQADTKGGARQKRPTETIRVEVERLDNLMDLVGELVLGRNRLLQLVSDMKASDNTDDLLRELNEANSQVDFITTELQTAVMHTRMVQMGRVFNKFPRVVRDLAKEFGKEIDLVIEGEETELDKSLVEEISDPLVHLVRNAADHGLETPEIREAAGKPRRGRMRLAAAHEGNHVVIEIEDDGAGIDIERVKQKALERGLVTEQEAVEMTEAQAFELLFLAGFSTAKKLSKVSGRGVGMDVVKTNISRLNGTITITSTPGQGARFTRICGIISRRRFTSPMRLPNGPVGTGRIPFSSSV